MVAYSFKQRFVGSIRAGTKTQTIRADRKRHARPGEALQIYTAMRTNRCRLIGNAVCVSIVPIRFDFDAQEVIISSAPPIADLPELDDFAISDGFEDFKGLAAFWRENHPGAPQWNGLLIRWSGFTLPVSP